MHNIVKLLCVTAASMLGLTAAQAQNVPLKLTLFGQPSVNNDAIWMAFEKGLYQEEGLDVTYRLFRREPRPSRHSRPARATSS